MFMKGTNELTVVKDWEQCQMELESDGTMSPTELDGGLWETCTQVRVFYGNPGEKANQSQWLHRRPRMWNVQNLPDVTIAEGRNRIVAEALQTVEHIQSGSENRTVYFDTEAPTFIIGCDTQLPETGHARRVRRVRTHCASVQVHVVRPLDDPTCVSSRLVRQPLVMRELKAVLPRLRGQEQGVQEDGLRDGNCTIDSIEPVRPFAEFSQRWVRRNPART